MAKKVIVREQKRGCLWACCMLLLICFAIYTLLYAVCVAAGIGLWFLIRYIWRSLVAEAPDSRMVRWGSKRTPIARKLLAAIPCVLLSLTLIGALGSSAAASKKTVDTSHGTTATSTKTGSSKKKASTATTTKTDERRADLDAFIAEYNNLADADFAVDEYFDPQDSTGSHYRTEYRLSAWKNGVGASGHIGSFSVDFVAYRDGVRMYAQGDTDPATADYAGFANMLRDAVKVYSKNADASALDQIATEYTDGTKRESISFASLDTDLNGYLNNQALMIENTHL